MSSSTKESRRDVFFPPAFFALVAATVLFRIGIGFSLPRTIKHDEPAYLLLGYNLFAGNGFTYSGYPELHFAPLFPIVAELFRQVTEDFEKASNLVYAFFGSLLLFPVFAMARRIYGLKTAWFAAVLLALFPPLTVNVLYWGTLTEPLYLCLLYGALAILLIALDDDRIGMFAAAGTLLGLAYLTRPEAVIYVGLFAVFAGIWLVKRVKRGMARTLLALTSYVLPFALVAAPYVWYLHLHTGQWMISGKVPVVWQEASNSDSIEFNRLIGGEIGWLSPDRLKVSFWHSLLTHPDDVFKRTIQNARTFKNRFFDRYSFWWGLTPLVIMALFHEPWDLRRLRHEAFLITVVLVPLLTFLPFFFLERFFAPTFPVLLIWTAHGALYLGAWLKNTVRLWRARSLSNGYLQSGLRWLPAGLVTGFMLVTIPFAAESFISGTSFGEKEAGLWLNSHAPADAKVMTREIGVALYAERRWLPLPHADWFHVLEYARKREANYIVVQDRYLNIYPPDVARALHKGTPELDLLVRFEEPRRWAVVNTFVYRIVEP